MDGEFYVDYTKSGNSWTWVPENKVRQRIGQSNKVKREFTSGGDAVDWMKYVDDEFSWQIQPEIRKIETESAVYKFVPKSDDIRDKSRALGRSTKLSAFELQARKTALFTQLVQLMHIPSGFIVRNLQQVFEAGVKKHDANNNS